MSLDTAALDAILADAVATGAAPALAVAVVGRDGVLYSGAEGVDPDAMFRYMSLTKAVTSVAALQLVERGLMSLDDAVATHLPEFGKLQVLDGFDPDGQPILRPPARPVVVRELMNHTSGLVYFFTDEGIVQFHETTGTPDLTSGKKVSLTEIPLARDPGVLWAYGTSTDWLGLLIEQLSGQPLDTYFDEHITGPLGITDITFHPTDEQRTRQMPLFGRAPDGSLVQVDLPGVEVREWWSGGDGLFGTADAYARFIQALLRGGELDGARILNEETVALAFADSLHGVPMPSEGIKSSNPMLTNDVPPFPFAEGWGLGFHLALEDLPGARRSGTGDWAGLFNCFYFVDRASGVGVVLLTQILPFFDQRIVETFMQIEGLVYAGLNASE